jgi:hypothetical protein
MKDSDGTMKNYSLDDIINTKSTNPKRPKDKINTLPEAIVTPKTHTATYNPLEGSTGAYAVKGWTTNAWGGGKKGVLDASIA